MHGPPAGHPAPSPELDATATPSTSLLLTDAVHHVECLEQDRGNGNALIKTVPSFFEDLEGEHGCGQVYAIDGRVKASLFYDSIIVPE